jgi:hypothetical protein
MHWPGNNFMGPGTHVIDRVMNGVQPTSRVDEISREHDIDYLDTTAEPIWADIKAVTSLGFDPSVEANAMRLGLGARSLVDAFFDLTLPVVNLLPGIKLKNPMHINKRTDSTGLSDRALQNLLRQRIKQGN